MYLIAKNSRPIVQSNCPVQLSSPTVQSNCPVQSSPCLVLCPVILTIKICDIKLFYRQYDVDDGRQPYVLETLSCGDDDDGHSNYDTMKLK